MSFNFFARTMIQLPFLYQSEYSPSKQIYRKEKENENTQQHTRVRTFLANNYHNCNLLRAKGAMLVIGKRKLTCLVNVILLFFEIFFHFSDSQIHRRLIHLILLISYGIKTRPSTSALILFLKVTFYFLLFITTNFCLLWLDLPLYKRHCNPFYRPSHSIDLGANRSCSASFIHSVKNNYILN